MSRLPQLAAILSGYTYEGSVVFDMYEKKDFEYCSFAKAFLILKNAFFFNIYKIYESLYFLF
jgi:hypothetical protein